MTKFKFDQNFSLGVPHSPEKRSYRMANSGIKPPIVEAGDDAKKGEISNRYFLRMNDFRKESKFCDLDIVIGSRTFPCHRVVLASASEFFDKMLGGLFEESKQRKITLNSVGAECFENILEFVYCKQMNIGERNSYDLLTASRYFNIEEMEDLCVRYMVENLPQRQIFETCTFAYLTGKKELYDAALKLIAANFATLSKNEEFLTVPFEVLEAIIKHESLERVDDLILDLIIRWKDAKNGDGGQVRSLLKNVNAGGVTGDFLAKVILNDDRLPSLNVRVASVEDMKYIVDEYMYLDVDRKWIPNVFFHKERFYEKNVIINERIFTLSCSGWTSDNKVEEQVAVNVFEATKSDEGTQRLKTPPMGVSSYLLSAIHNTIYLHVSDIILKHTDEANPLPKAKDAEKSKSLLAYVYDLDEWFAVPKPKFEVVNSCMATMDNLLYLVGGSKYMAQDFEFAIKGYAQCYDPRSPTWIPLPEMSYSHWSGAACPFNGKLYVLGGAACRFFEVFDPVAGRWEELKAPSYDHSSFSFVSFRNSLWAIGNGNGVEIATECYHVDGNIWTNVATLKQSNNRNVRVVDAIVM